MVNNTIVSLEKPFVDARGEIQPLVDIDIKSCVLINSKKGTVRANHYHKTDWHYCYVLEGSIEYYHRSHGSNESPQKETVKAGQMFFTPPKVDHAMVFPEDTVFITFGRNSRKQEVYEADVVRIEPINPVEVADKMEKPYKHRSTCRLCGSSDLTMVLQLEPSALANAFVTLDALKEEQQRFPLDVFFCESCAHLQLLDVVDPRILFEHYVYVSGTSPVFQKHFENYAKDIIEYFSVARDSLVVDIGSNDGTLLRFFKDAGCRTLGVDPAREIAQRATKEGIETLQAFFTQQLAKDILANRGPAAVVTANNVFAHIDDMTGTVEGIRTLLAPDGVFVFEVSYLVDVFGKTLFDMIYHEHLAYHSVKPLIRFMNANGMELIEAFRVNSHGGSLRGVAQLKAGPRQAGSSVSKAVELEERLALDKADTFRLFAHHIQERKQELSALLKDLKSKGKRIAGFGAPAKATTLMYHFGIGPEIIDFIVDDSPLKQGLYTPGMHIPVLPSRQIYEQRADYVVVLAWNFAEPIMKKHAAFHKAGGRFIVPLPIVEVY